MEQRLCVGVCDAMISVYFISSLTTSELRTLVKLIGPNEVSSSGVTEAADYAAQAAAAESDEAAPTASAPSAAVVQAEEPQVLTSEVLVPPACGTWTNGTTKRQAPNHADGALATETGGLGLASELAGLRRPSWVCGL